MYAGFVTSKHSQTWLGAHQKFNRAAFRALKKLKETEPDLIGVGKYYSRFPRLKMIQHFEGINGPDGIKVKDPGGDEPWHFYDPFNKDDTEIFNLIEQHLQSMTLALKAKSEEKTAFEASWLAHTITDGLTPAHHYPYEQEMESIRGEHRHTRNSKTKKVLIKGVSAWDSVKRNWKVLGRKGLLSTHIGFEMGVTAAILPHRIIAGMPSALEVQFAKEKGIVEVFKKYAEQIGKLNLYGRYYETGWTPRIAREVRYTMSPLIVRCITLAWMLALEESNNK